MMVFFSFFLSKSFFFFFRRDHNSVFLVLSLLKKDLIDWLKQILELITHHITHVEVTHVTDVIVVTTRTTTHGIFLLTFLLHVFVIHFLLGILLLEESFLRELLSLLDRICDDDIIKQRTSLDLPDFEPDMRTPVLTDLVHFLVVLVVRVVNHGVFPWSFVVRVVNHLRLPFTFEVRIVNHRCLPFTIIFIIPIVWLGRVGVGDFLRDVIVPVRFLIFRVGHFWTIDPIPRLASVRVLDLFLRQKVELFVELSRTDGLAIDLDLDGVVWVDDERVQMCQVVRFCIDFILNQKIVIFLVRMKDDMRLLVGRTTNIRSEHDTVRSVPTKACSVELVTTGQQLDVRTATIKVLFVLDRVLDDQGFVATRNERLV
mmetsp:Transcript_50248/g.121710  ORF Transcript_50248/g.121710 Transcript_50248/m.121710 type:complete len:371 (-) Transcript_50248:278-1390(-)